MPLAYSYTRLSTSEQAQGNYARGQIELAKVYATKQGLTLDDNLRFSGAGVTPSNGADLRKGALGQFLSAIDDGKVPEGSFLLVESLDPISRQDPWEIIPIFQMIINAGVTIATLFDKKIYTRAEMRKDPFESLQSLFIFIRASATRGTKSRRAKVVWAAKRRRAPDQALTRRLPGWLRMEAGKILPVPERAQVVRRIVKDFLAGVGQHRIAQTLNREGVSVFGNGTMWHRSYINKLLRSPALIGNLVPREVVYESGKRTCKALQPIENYFPAVITYEEWKDLGVLLISGRRQPKQHAKGIQSILAGLAQCSLCGSAMSRLMKGSSPKSGRPTLVCTRARSGAGCRYYALDLDAIESAIREGLSGVLAGVPRGEAEVDAEVETLRNQVNRANRRISLLIDELLERGRSPALMTSLADAEAHMAVTEASLRHATTRQASVSPESIERRRRELLDAISDPIELLNVKLRQMFSRVVPDHRDGRLRFWWKDGTESTISLPFAAPIAAEHSVANQQHERQR